MTQHRFVILVGDPQAFPKRLIAGLDGRNVKAVTVYDAPWVMAELAEPTHTLVVTEPAKVRQLDGLIEAIRAYYPAVRFWQYGREIEGQPAPALEPMFARSRAKRSHVAAPPAPVLQPVNEAPPVAAPAPAAVEPEPVAPPRARDASRDMFTVPPPPSDREAMGEEDDASYTVFANTEAAGSEEELSSVAEEQFRNMMSQMHEQVLRSPLPFMAPGAADHNTPLITPEELAMLMGPIPDREEDADTSTHGQGRKESTS